MTHIPYLGSSQVVTALASRDVQVLLGGANLGMQLMRSGKLRALAVASAVRLPVLPEVPTFAEVGLADLKARNWWALAAPRGTAPAVISKLAAAVQGAIVIGGRAQAMVRQLIEETKPWQKVLADSGVKAR